ncbi:MAG TPA: hypothetical protein VJ281_01670 [Chthoniobacterales bacterium]|jgi:hypothetical protein|nr:hypothetical protein [Chthoniobacterales bacterium]
MNYNELIQLYFERTTALQNYWNLYVVAVGGLLAFSSLRKQPALVTTLIVSLLFGLFAYENYDAIQIATGQRLAVHESITKFDAGAAGPTAKPVRDVLEPTLTPASHASVRTTHLTSDILVIAGLWAMEFRRRRMSGAASVSEK